MIFSLFVIISTNILVLSIFIYVESYLNIDNTKIFVEFVTNSEKIIDNSFSFLADTVQ